MENEDQEKININDLKKLLELNLQKNEEILLISREIKNFIKWQQIWSVLRFALIVVPIILGFIYLPPLFQGVLESYKELLR